MQNPIRRVLAGLSIFFICLTPSLSAQALSLADCRQMEDALERFACYEKLEEPSGQIASPAPVNNLPVLTRPGRVVEPAQVEAPAQAAVIVKEDESAPLLKRLWPFGGNKTVAEPLEQSPEPPKAVASSTELDSFGLQSSVAEIVSNGEGQQELHDRVASLKKVQHNQWQITLESGQVWKQMISEVYLLKVGDMVRIYPSGWGGSFRLTAEGKVKFIQVERLK